MRRKGKQFSSVSFWNDWFSGIVKGDFCLTRCSKNLDIYTTGTLCIGYAAVLYYATPCSECLKFVKGERLQSCNEVYLYLKKEKLCRQRKRFEFLLP